ncbi:hypothetical protein ACFL2D_02095, partial [Patescibacteria group bacterium]
CDAIYNTLDSEVLLTLERWEESGLKYHLQKYAWKDLNEKRTEKNPRNKEESAYRFTSPIDKVKVMKKCVVYLYLAYDYEVEESFVIKRQFDEDDRRDEIRMN